jgi:hypothetical protein
MNWKALEHWLTTTVPGLIVVSVIAIFLAALIAKVAGKLWRAYFGVRVLDRVLHFIETSVRPFVISRVLTNRYIHDKDYFRYVSHTGFAIMAFALSSLVELILFGLIAVYFIVNGIRFSWALFVLFSLTGFFLVGWIKETFYLLGIIEQTFFKDLQRYNKVFPKLHPKFLMRLMTENIDEVLKEQEKAIQAQKAGQENSAEASQKPPSP